MAEFSAEHRAIVAGMDVVAAAAEACPECGDPGPWWVLTGPDPDLECPECGHVWRPDTPDTGPTPGTPPNS